MFNFFGNQNDNYNNAYNSQYKMNIINEYWKGRNAISAMDVGTADSSQTNLKSSLSFLQNGEYPQIVALYKFICNTLEICIGEFKSRDLNNQERFKKSLEESHNALALSDAAIASYKTIPQQLIVQENLWGIMPYCQNTIVAFRPIIYSTVKMTEGFITRQQGGFFDELKITREVIDSLKTIDESKFEPDSTNSSISLMIFVNKLIELYERRADMLEEKRKKTEYLNPIGKNVFIVHGHDYNALSELENMLENDLGINPIILKDEYTYGGTIIEKFEDFGKDCAFAYVIFTADDVVENKGRSHFQGRPNVLFELGWFCGRYGRDKVRILKQRDTVLPSDLNGLTTINFTKSLTEVFDIIKADLQNVNILK